MPSLKSPVSAVAPIGPSPPSVDDYELVKILRQGTIVTQFVSRDKVSKAPVVVKSARKGTSHEARLVQGQKAHQRVRDASFVVPLLASFHDSDYLFTVEAWCPGRDLDAIVTREGPFPESDVRFYAAELFVALEELKAKHVLHRDIKTSNIVLSASGHVRLVGFHSATILEEARVDFDADPDATSGRFDIPAPSFTSIERVGSLGYMSPEVHAGQPYSFEADLHGLGVTLYNLLTGRIPFGFGWADSEDEFSDAVLNEPLQFREDDKVSPEAKDLLRILLGRRGPQGSPEIESLFSHPFFAGVDWYEIRSQTAEPPRVPAVKPLGGPSTKYWIPRGGPCSQDLLPDFTFVSAELSAQRTHYSGLFQRVAGLFTAPRSPNSRRLSLDLPIQDPPSPPPVEITGSYRPSSLRSPTDNDAVFGERLPPRVTEGLRKRKATSKPRPFRADMSMTITPPRLVLTHADKNGDDLQLSPDACESSPLRAPFFEIANDAHLLSPADADRTWTPKVKIAAGAPIKLADPPKNRRRQRQMERERARAQKEKENEGKGAKEIVPEIEGPKANLPTVDKVPSSAVNILPAPKTISSPAAQPIATSSSETTPATESQSRVRPGSRTLSRTPAIQARPSLSRPKPVFKVSTTISERKAPSAPPSPPPAKTSKASESPNLVTPTRQWNSYQRHPLMNQDTNVERPVLKSVMTGRKPVIQQAPKIITPSTAQMISTAKSAVIGGNARARPSPTARQSPPAVQSRSPLPQPKAVSKNSVTTRHKPEIYRDPSSTSLKTSKPNTLSVAEASGPHSRPHKQQSSSKLKENNTKSDKNPQLKGVAPRLA
ncbi:hypothetical protein H0H92_002892 [Tricholoma furcatifolium]|nr:hypothetical protein H0H92_002892 [Tricholoma furcatifolium]